MVAAEFMIYNNHSYSQALSTELVVIDLHVVLNYVCVMSLLLCVHMRVVLVQGCTRVHGHFMIPSNPVHTIEYATTTDLPCIVPLYT